jgi:hypothetical protein
VGKPLTLTTSGGSGIGTVTFTVTNGTPKGCVVSGGSLSSTTAGTCTVTATKAADTTYLVAISTATTATFAVSGPSAFEVHGFVTAGQTRWIDVTGTNFYGRPTVTGHGGTTALVAKDTGKWLRVRVSVKAGSRNGTFTFTITLANGQSCRVRYVQKA